MASKAERMLALKREREMKVEQESTDNLAEETMNEVIDALGADEPGAGEGGNNPVDKKPEDKKPNDKAPDKKAPQTKKEDKPDDKKPDDKKGNDKKPDDKKPDDKKGEDKPKEPKPRDSKPKKYKGLLPSEYYRSVKRDASIHIYLSEEGDMELAQRTISRKGLNKRSFAMLALDTFLETSPAMFDKLIAEAEERKTTVGAIFNEMLEARYK